jgi:hypothetical protein
MLAALGRVCSDLDQMTPPIRAMLAVLPLALAACDVPGPASPFAGVPAERIVIAGSTFSVRIAGEEAQAVRLDPDFRASARRILPRAGVAMERVSGCEVVSGSLRGDAAMAMARLTC